MPIDLAFQVADTNSSINMRGRILKFITITQGCNSGNEFTKRAKEPRIPWKVHHTKGKMQGIHFNQHLRPLKLRLRDSHANVTGYWNECCDTHLTKNTMVF